MNVLTLKISEELERELENAASVRRVSKSRLAREAIAAYVRHPGVKRGKFVSALDLAGDLAGRIRRAPRNLAVDSRFMKGYGRD